MKLLYLTTALHPRDYANLLHEKKTAPNPSNQNFHTKLITYLEKNHDVKILSRQTMTKSLIAKQKENGNYLYPGFLNIPIIRNIMTINFGVSYADRKSVV